MKSASQLFDEAERKRIDEAVRAAEKNTSGEIVPVIATISGRYERAADLFGLLLGIVFMIGWWFLRLHLFKGDSWEPAPLTLPGFALFVLVLLIGFSLGVALASRIRPLASVFVSQRDKQEAVERRAHEVFRSHHLTATKAATGVLIYVSLYERMVRVIGDEAINAKLREADWHEICDHVVTGMREGQALEGLKQGIALSGELLAQHFPIAPGDVNELDNGLVLLD